MNIQKRKAKLIQKLINAKDKPVLKARLVKQVKALRAEYNDMRERTELTQKGIRV